ncbi:MAG: phosphate ABC transporter permease PstA [Bacilli bacterium]
MKNFIDKISLGTTWFLSGIGFLFLILIYAFIFNNGFGLINTQLLTGDYWSEVYYLNPSEESIREFSAPDDLDGGYFSSKYGIVLKDYTTSQKDEVVMITYIDENSIFNSMKNETTGENQVLELNSDFNKVTYIIDDSYYTTGSSKKENAETIVSNLEKSDSVYQIFIKTQSGGIRGSIIATVILIVTSILLSMPVSIFAAIYLAEYSKKNIFTKIIRLGIELLSGVPSIIFGLVGLVIFYPIAEAFNAIGPTLLLGSLTMIIVLLPVSIKTVEETLYTVPDSLRESSLSLGATKFQTIFKVVLPSSLSGILTALLLAIGRIIGETAALIYTIGTVVNDNPKLNTGGTTLAVQIWKEMSGEQPNIELASAISLVILILVLVLNIIVKFISRRIEIKYS